jgi:hypothetical protein
MFTADSELENTSMKSSKARARPDRRTAALWRAKGDPAFGGENR